MTQVFNHLQIRGYRGFEVVNLSQLGQVNIFVGNNNSGKTSLLEAISILCNPLDPFQWLEVSQRRLYLGRASVAGLRPNLEAVKWMFPQKMNFSRDAFHQDETLRVVTLVVQKTFLSLFRTHVLQSQTSCFR